MKTRARSYQDLELGPLNSRTLAVSQHHRGTQVTPPLSQHTNSSTCLTMESFGFYPELTFKKKALLLLCALLAAYETFTPVEKGVEDFTGLFSNSQDLRQGLGRGPTMTIAYLLKTGLTFRDAFDLVKKVRTFINPRPGQIARLKELEQYYKTNTAEQTTV